MDSLPLIKGFGIGLAVAAPVGPMSVLCMRRTLMSGWRAGFTTGLGIATGDGVYAFVAGLGLVGVSGFMLFYARPLHLLAGCFLVYLGLKTVLTRAAPLQASKQRSAASAYGSALLLTLTNPPTILSFAAIFTALAPASGLTASASAETVAGIFLGSTLWWLLLTIVIRSVGHVAGRGTTRWIAGISGALLSLFGLTEIRRAF